MMETKGTQLGTGNEQNTTARDRVDMGWIGWVESEHTGFVKFQTFLFLYT